MPSHEKREQWAKDPPKARQQPPTHPVSVILYMEHNLLTLYRCQNELVCDSRWSQWMSQIISSCSWNYTQGSLYMYFKTMQNMTSQSNIVEITNILSAVWLLYFEVLVLLS